MYSLYSSDENTYRNCSAVASGTLSATDVDHLATQTWIKRIDQFNQVRAQYGRTKRLPSLEEMGLPRTLAP